MNQDYIIIVAGGKGLRMGGDLPKQFVPIGDMPVLMRTLHAFHAAMPELQLILVLPAGQQDYWRQLCSDYGFTLPHQLATGGETRFHSVQNGLLLIPDAAEGVVGVHDGVRPFVSAEVIRTAYDAARQWGSAVPVVPIVETVRELQSDGCSSTVDRTRYRLVQTPQTFTIPLLKAAYRQSYMPAFTDDASVVEALGHSIHLTEGNRENIKMTTPSDLHYAEYLCQLLS